METGQARSPQPEPEKPAERARGTQTQGAGATTTAEPARLPVWSQALGDGPAPGLAPPVAALGPDDVDAAPEVTPAGHPVQGAAGLPPAAPPALPPPSPPFPRRVPRIRTAGPLVQRAPVDAGSASTTAPVTEDVEDVAAEPAPSLLVEDDAVPAAHQMGRTAFMAALREEVCTTVDEVLAGTPYSTRGCPYVEFWLGYYSGRDAGQIERAVYRYAPGARGATSAHELIAHVRDRVREATQTWLAIGRVTGVPQEIPATLFAPPIPAPAEQTGGGASAEPVAALPVNGASAAPANPAALRRQLGRGQPLDGSVRTRLEPALGADLSHVRVHTDPGAAGLSGRLRARAFTVGEHVAFGAGQYRPGTPIGDALLAHELAHTVQQSGVGTGAEPALSRGTAHDAGQYASLEQEADTSAFGVVTQLWGQATDTLGALGRRVTPAIRSGLRLQRCGDNSDEPDEQTTELATGQPQVETPSATPPPAVDPAQVAAETTLTDLRGIEWQPIASADAVLAILAREGTEDRLYLLPARGLAFEVVPPRGTRAQPQRGPIFSMPAVGHAGIHMVHTGQGTGLLIDAAGTLRGQPIAMLPRSLAALQARYGISNIVGALLSHTHADHVSSLPDLVSNRRLSGNSIWVHPGWQSATRGPLAQVWSTLQTAAFTQFGFGPGWQAASLNVVTAASVSGGSGVTRATLTVGESRLEIVTLTAALRSYTQALQAGQTGSRFADAASMFTRVSHAQAGYDIVMVGDMRGRTLLQLSNEMGIASFNQFVANARVIVGLHHLGAVSTRQDVEGLQRLLDGMGAGRRQITVVAQGGTGINMDLVRALQNSGARVLVLPELDPAQLRTIVASSTGQVRAQGASEYAVDPAVRQAQGRIERMERAAEFLEAVPTHIAGTARPASEVAVGLRGEIARLAGLLRQRQILATNQVHASTRSATAEADLTRNGGDLQRVEGTERQLGESEINRLARSRSETTELTRELAAARSRGAASERLRRLIAEVSPSVARQILMDELGRPMSRRQERRAMRRALTRLRSQARAQQLLATGPRTGRGARGFAIFMLGMQAFELAEPFIEQAITASRNRTRNDVYLFTDLAIWWSEKGVPVPVRGRSGGQEITDGQQLLNGLQRRIYDDMPEARRREVTLPDEVQQAQPIEQLFIPPPDQWQDQAPVWDIFNLWVSTHVQTFDDYAAEFADDMQTAVRRQAGAFGHTNWEVRVGEMGDDGHVQDRYMVSPQLTAIMNATALRAISGTKAQIERTWQQRDPVGRPRDTGPSISAAGSRSTAPTGRPTRRARFTDGTGDVYSDYENGPRELTRFRFWAENPYFLVYENDWAPEGYVWVSGADYNTHGALRSANVDVLMAAVDIPRMPRTLDVWSPDFGRDIPDEEYMNPEQLGAMQMLRQRVPGVFFRSYDESRSSGFRGQVRVWVSLPNAGGRVLVRRDDLTFERE